jgi:predicted nucleotidyltransferase
MRFGLKTENIKQISNIVSSFTEVQQAIIFGSRAMGNYKNGSDVDIALKGENITYEIVTQIKYQLNEETTMPYFFDVVDYDRLKNEDLKTHIDQFGKALFTKPLL